MLGSGKSRHEVSSGAFRHVISGTKSARLNTCGYDRCDRCGLIFEMTRVVQGLPNYSNAEAARRGWEARSRQDALDKRLGPLFKKASNRCICDPEGDARYLQQIDKADETNAPRSGNRNVGESSGGLSEQLEKLTELFNAGALSKEQFEAAKNALLGLS